MGECICPDSSLEKHHTFKNHALCNHGCRTSQTFSFSQLREGVPFQRSRIDQGTVQDMIEANRLLLDMPYESSASLRRNDQPRLDGAMQHCKTEPMEEATMKESHKTNSFFRSVTVWEPRTGGQDVETRSSRSHFPHDERDTEPNSQVRQRTVNGKLRAIGQRRRCFFLLERTVAVGSNTHGDRESHRLRPWTSSTRYGNSDSHYSCRLSPLVLNFSPR